jgi:CHASE2 domain-containing sensor protein
LACLCHETNYPPPVQFFKAFAVVLALAFALGISILIMVKGSGLISTIPFFGYLIGFIYLFAKYGCLHDESEPH